MDLSTVVWVGHLASTLFMTGVIWFVQIVHYPLFQLVGQSTFAEYEREHTRRTSWVVMVPMLLELSTAVALLWFPERLPRELAAVGLGLVAILWVSTALAQVPRHRELESGFVLRAHRSLVNSNWWRTIAWTLRSFLLLSCI